MPPNNNRELYALVRELSAALDQFGAAKLSNELRGALVASSMPSEILGEVRLALQAIKAHEAYRRLDIRSRVDDGIAYVSRAFGE
jgi:hypothetical protein